MTFTFDRDTVSRLRQAATRLARPQSQVARAAIREYAERIGSLSEEGRGHMLHVLDTVVPAIPVRPLRQLEVELAEIRPARRRGGRWAWTHTHRCIWKRLR